MHPDELQDWLLREMLLRTLAGINPGEEWQPSAPPPLPDEKDT